ncbi:MAG TPA: MFS transporter [bacterium]|nr:MFS transporter [bacterium]HQG44316.1 MFS transporter [bacterium]HQI48934.1 MFS transporter [bacterium]HQJ64456.1 MFS transporter [bacterium]
MELVDGKPLHSRAFRWRRFLNWFPLGLTYAFLYMGRYNLTVSKNALGELMTKADFGTIFGAGTLTYAFSFLLNGPLTDRIGGKRAMLIGSAGAALMNVAMGILTWLLLTGGVQFNMVLWFSLLYAANMYFQSFGAVAIVKTNSNWFHIRERGTFGGIFGILISLGLYFAFDWGQFIVNATVANPQKLSFLQRGLRSLLAVDGSSGIDQTWWLFFVPAIVLGIFFLLDLLILREKPSGAGFADFNTGDATSGEGDRHYSTWQIIIKVLTNPILITIACIEFCSGVMRNGIMHWYLIFTADMGYAKDFYITANWGFLLMIAGVFGGILAGWISDKVFGSRRGPVAALLYGVLLLSTLAMWPFVTRTNNGVADTLQLTIQPKQIAKYAAVLPLSLGQIEEKVAARYTLEKVDSLIWKIHAADKSSLTASRIADIPLAEYQRFNKYKNKNETMRIQVKEIGTVQGAPVDTRAYALGFIVVLMSLAVIGVHGMLSGTSTMDFGGTRGAATATGLIDGFVYLGTGVQSLSLGFLTSHSWNYWPPFLVPFALIGLVLAIRIWHAFPDAKRKAH